MRYTRTADSLSRLGFRASNIAAKLRDAGLVSEANAALSAAKELHWAADRLTALTSQERREP